MISDEKLTLVKDYIKGQMYFSMDKTDVEVEVMQDELDEKLASWGVTDPRIIAALVKLALTELRIELNI